MNPREAEGFRYDRHWAGFDGSRARTTWVRLPEVLPAVGDESLDRRTLYDVAPHRKTPRTRTSPPCA